MSKKKITKKTAKKSDDFEYWLTNGVKKYYGKKLNIVQIYPDPNVMNCYVIRVEDKKSNWVFVINTDYGDDFESCMIDDQIELKPGQKITKRMFAEVRLF